MQPSRILAFLALGISSFSSLAYASGSDKEKKQPEKNEEGHLERRKKLRVINRGTGSAMPNVTIADSKKYLSETSRDRCIRESKSTNLENGAEVDWLQNSENEGVSEDEGIFQPLIIDDDEVEDQKNPKNFMARIMVQYRKDMGLNPVLDFGSPNASAAEVSRFLECFEDRPENISEVFEKIVDAYSFFQYVGIIPLNPEYPAQCQEIKEKARLSAFEDILQVYKTKMDIFTVIDWDLLNLVPFKYQNFPISGSVIRTFKFQNSVFGKPKAKKTYVAPLSLTLYGKNLLEKNVEKIRFLNPETLKGRATLLYQRIYRRYREALKDEANPLYIDWKNCTVENWPSEMSKSRVLKWTDDQITLMNGLIDEELLKFRYSKVEVKNAPEPLGQSKRRSQDFYVDIEEFEGDKNTSISDDEKVCGSKKPLIKIAALRDNFDIDEKRRISLEDSKIRPKIGRKFDNVARTETTEQKGKLRSNEKAKKQQVEPKVYSDEEAEFDDDYIAKTSAKSSKAITTKSPKPSKPVKPIEEAEGTKIINVKDDTSAPADPKERQNLLNDILEMFRKETGQANASEIDWKLSRVHILQNHLLPFSTNFETVGDIKTFENLMSEKAFRFLNLSKLADRRIRVYERLYAIYAEACGKYRHDYDIKWGHVEFTGWPRGMKKNYKKWNDKEVEEIEKLLDSNAITCELTEEMKEDIAEVEAELQAKLEGDVELSESPVSSSSPSLASDVEMTSEMATNTSTIASIEGNSKPKYVMYGRWELVKPSPMEEIKTTPGFKMLLNVKSPKKRPLIFVNDSEEEEDEEIVSDKNEETSGREKMAKHEHNPVEQASDLLISTASPNAIDEDRVISFGDFAGNTVGQLLAHRNTIEISISEYLKLRESFREYSRQRRIINYIVECLELILDNVRNFEDPEPRKMRILDVHEYLNVFLDTLAALGQADEIRNRNDWKKLVITTVQFRAHLAGATAKYNEQGKFKVKIPASIIANSDLFGFLSRPVSTWNLEILDYFMDGDKDIQIFKNN